MTPNGRGTTGRHHGMEPWPAPCEDGGCPWGWGETEDDMIEITIRPHAHIVDMLADPGDDASDIWLGRHLPWSAAARLERYQELATARILEAIDGAEVVWSSEQVGDSGGVEEVEITPEDEAVRRRVEHILGQTLQEVCQWEPEVEEGMG